MLLGRVRQPAACGKYGKYGKYGKFSALILRRKRKFRG
jgi:hypothetical protein